MTKKYYELTPDERLASLHLDQRATTLWHDNQSETNAQLIENYVSDMRIPIGILKDIVVDDKHYAVPMATEEPSVIAAANHGAKLLNNLGGLHVKSPRQTAMIGQLLFYQTADDAIAQFVSANQQAFFECAKHAKPSIYRRNGGLLSVNARRVSPTQVSVDFLIDTKDAMGANIVNTILEAERAVFSSFEANFLGAILSNYATEQVVTVSAEVTVQQIGGQHIAEKIVALNDFAKHDIYRATTENKGIFNGISAVALATGNDWRAVEAAGHAYASRTGCYQALTTWHIVDNLLLGEISMPITVGTVGGTITALPQAKQALEVMTIQTANQLRGIMLAVGLAQNLAALKAIVDGGIQRGHMRMQYRALALQVGATVEELPNLVFKLSQEQQVDARVAQELLTEMRK